MLFAGDIDLKDPQLIVNKIAPDLGQRIGDVVGDVQRAVDAVKSASTLLQSGDGLAIASGVSGWIQAFTGWLKGKIEADSQDERENIYKAQQVFIGPPGARWMWRQPVGGPPASKVQLRKTITWTGAELLKQYNPGAVYIFPRISWDVIRRSFRRTDAPNVFDLGQPLVWTAKENEVANCVSRVADYWDGRGCGYNPKEMIQLSAGTWPYWCGAQVTNWSGVTAADMAGHHMALMTPSALHVQTDAGQVEQIYTRWKNLLVNQLPQLPQVGQVENGAYRTATGQVFVAGDPTKIYIPVGIEGKKYNVRGDAAVYVTDCFIGFLELRKAVIRDFAYLAPSVKEAAKASADPTMHAIANGLPLPGKGKNGKLPKGPGGIKSPGGTSGGGGGGGIVLVAGVAAAALLFGR